MSETRHDPTNPNTDESTRFPSPQLTQPKAASGNESENGSDASKFAELASSETQETTTPIGQRSKDVAIAELGLTIGSENVAGAFPREAKEPAPPFIIDNAQPLDPRSFPNPPQKSGTGIASTIPNVKYLLQSYRITVRYDEIKKKMLIVVPGYAGTPDNADNVAITHIHSLANLNGMSTNQLLSYICVIGDANRLNRVADWIQSKAWDGVDRLPEFYDTLKHREDFPAQLKETLIYRWMISAVAAVMQPRGFRARGVLTIQGPQSIGKTTWIKNLVSDAFLREDFVKLDHHLDAANKDSLLTAVSHWIVEIGELDSSFKKDIARLKGFLTADQDKVRRPYGRTDSEYPRRTVFCATVNDSNFLVDSTGNSRWWTIPVTSINYAHGIDMQQLFAQVAVAFRSGEPWWLTQAEEVSLELSNANHRTISAIRERILSEIDLEPGSKADFHAMTASAVLMAIGIRTPSNTQCKECAAVLREYLGEPKKIKGFYKWRVPIKESSEVSRLEMLKAARSDPKF